MGKIEDIQWVDYLFRPQVKALIEAIELAENTLHIRLPEDFKSIVIEHQGQAPIPDIFDISGENNNSVFNYSLPFCK
jgi:hypothetical protein